jgi:hypothetical protein
MSYGYGYYTRRASMNSKSQIYIRQMKFFIDVFP